MGTADEENQFLEDAYQELGKDSFHLQSWKRKPSKIIKTNLYSVHCKKKVSDFPVPSRDVTNLSYSVVDIF